jgi:sodium transport system permease protein
MSIRLRIIATIWKKELRETLRDRRTLFMMIVLPVLLYPLLFTGLSRLAESESEATRVRPSIVAVWGPMPQRLEHELASRSTLAIQPWLGAPEDVRRDLGAGRLKPPPTRIVDSRQVDRRNPDEQSRVEELPNPVLAAARELIASRRADAVLVIWQGSDAIAVYFDSVRQDSQVALGRVRRALEAYARQVVKPAFDLASRDVAPPSRQAGRVIGAILPLMLVTLCIAGGLYPAIDLTAGEKERGTMQTLMCAPVLPAEIIVGKFLTVWTITMTSALANVVSLAMTLTRMLPVDGAAVPVSSYALTTAMLVPVTLLTSAVFLALAVFAKDFKDGQSLLTPVYMALALPAMVTVLPTIELNAWTTFVPIVNIALLIKSLLLSEARAELVFLTLVSSAVYAALGLSLAVHVFRREQILLGARESVRNLFAADDAASSRRRAARVPSPGLALLLFSLALVAAFYGSLALESRGIIVTLLAMQLGFFLLPLIVLTAALRLDVRETFSLRRPRLVLLVASAVLGLTAWTFASGVLLRLAPPPETLVKALERIFMIGDKPMPLWMIWLVVGIMPGVCEEALFRGFILSGLRPLGPTAAIGISALLFGLAHASIYRLLPTFFLGILLGIVVWRTGSLLCSITMHAINNGFIGTLTQSPDVVRALGLREGADALPWPQTIAGSSITLAALLLILAMSARGTGLVRKRTDTLDAPGAAGAASP